MVSARQTLTMYYYPAELEPGGTYYWRVDEIEKDLVTIHTGDVWSFTARALAAYLPEPADGSVTASPAAVLTWRPGLDAMTHQLYLGTDRDAVTQGAAIPTRVPWMAPGGDDLRSQRSGGGHNVLLASRRDEHRRHGRHR